MACAPVAKSVMMVMRQRIMRKPKISDASSISIEYRETLHFGQYESRVLNRLKLYKDFGHHPEPLPVAVSMSKTKSRYHRNGEATVKPDSRVLGTNSVYLLPLVRANHRLGQDTKHQDRSHELASPDG
jgi:hypothetical protein